MRVGYVENPYKSDNGGALGMSMFLNGVQVVELVEYRGDTAGRHGFPVEKLPDGEPKVIPEAAASAPTGAASSPPPPEDDLPF